MTTRAGPPFSPACQVYRVPLASDEVGANDELVDDDERAEIPDDWEDLSEEAGSEAVAEGAGVGSAEDGGLSLEGISLEEEKNVQGGGEGGRAEAEVDERLDGEDREDEAASVAVMDGRLLSAFLNGLKKTLKDKDLPMLVRCVFRFLAPSWLAAGSRRYTFCSTGHRFLSCNRWGQVPPPP